MSEEATKVDANYKKAFNQGYQFSKEVGISSETFKDLSSDNTRMEAMRDGMEQYSNEQTIEKNKDIIPPFDMDSFDNSYVNINVPDKSKDKDIEPEL